VRTLIVAGEPGGSIPATRDRIQRLWDARVIDHHGLTEVGPVSFECWESPGALHVNEVEYVCEVLDPSTGIAVPEGQRGELVITNLGRSASPVIRYRTGDMVIKRFDPCPCGRTLVRLEGGILGRADDMISVRGVNVFPAAMESVVRSFPEIVEFRTTVSSARAMRTLSIEIEPAADVSDVSAVASRLSGKLREALGLTIPVRAVPPGTLPRFEMKARRFIVEP
jgi:phenylacetate-CoA ligase